MQIKQYTCVKNKEGRVFLRCIQEYPFGGVVEIIIIVLQMRKDGG